MPRKGRNQMRSRQSSIPSGGPRYLSPPVSFGKIGATVEDRLLIEQAGGRKLGSVPFNASTLPSRVAVYSMMPDVFPGCSTLAAPSNAVVAGIGPYYLQLFRELCAQMIRDKVPVSPLWTTIAQVDITNFLTFYGQAYGAYRTAEAICNSPAFNLPFGAMVEIVTQQEIAVKAGLQTLNAIGVPPMYRDILDNVFGVFTPEPSGAIIISAPKDGVYAAGTMVDWANAASVTTYLQNANGVIFGAGGIMATTNLAFISGVFFSAYGGEAMAPKGPNADQRAYDMYMTRCIYVNDTTSVKLFMTPAINLDSFGRVPILVRRNTWIDGDLLAKMYSSLVRIAPLGATSGASMATAEIFGMFQDDFGTGFGTVVSVYLESSTTINAVVASSQAAASTGITLTDPISWEFPWAAQTTFETLNYTTGKAPFPDLEIVETSIVEMADAVYYILNEMFGTGYRGGTFTPSRNW